MAQSVSLPLPRAMLDLLDRHYRVCVTVGACLQVLNSAIGDSASIPLAETGKQLLHPILSYLFLINTIYHTSLLPSFHSLADSCRVSIIMCLTSLSPTFFFLPMHPLRHAVSSVHSKRSRPRITKSYYRCTQCRGTHVRYNINNLQIIMYNN